MEGRWHDTISRIKYGDSDCQLLEVEGKEYPSLCIKPSTNQWYFHYTREGATNNSINCLTKVIGMDFNQAVFALTGQDITMLRAADFKKSVRPAMTTPPRLPRREPEKKDLQMPEQSEQTLAP